MRDKFAIAFSMSIYVFTYGVFVFSALNAA